MTAADRACFILYFVGHVLKVLQTQTIYWNICILMAVAVDKLFFFVCELFVRGAFENVRLKGTLYA